MVRPRDPEAFFPIGFELPELRVRPVASKAGATDIAFDLIAYPGQAVDIEDSADLVHWSRLTTIRPTASATEVANSAANPGVTHFYRAVASP